MFSSPLASAAVLLSALSLATAQTFTDCDPTKTTCDPDPGYGKGNQLFTDFTKGASSDWQLAEGTTLEYGSEGAKFQIKQAGNAPTIESEKYIMFGQVDVFMRASAGQGIVSSFILESDDLDEIDWEWLGGADTQVQTNFFGKGNTTSYDRGAYHDVATPIESYRNYSIHWTAESTIWSIDGKVVRTLAFNDPKAVYGQNYPQTPMKVKMGNWIGCLDAAAAADPKTKGTCDWAGGPADFSKSASNPWTMYVANVTINDFGCGGNYTYSDKSGSWQSIKCDGKSSSGSSAVSSSAAPSTSSSAAATKSTTSGAILVETATTSSVSTSATAKTTLSTTASSQTPAQVTTGSSTTSSGPAQATTSDSNSMKPKHKYGVVDFTIIALGLGLGYLVM